MVRPVRITAQAVGAYGERIVEAELLRQGWLPGNLNHSVTNAARFDIIAVKVGAERIVPIRVKTCSSKYTSFQFSVKESVSDNPFLVREDGDFMAIVAMGDLRKDDRIFIIATATVQAAVLKWRNEYLSTPKRDGGDHKSTSQWTLHLRGDPAKSNYGFNQKWKDYENAWSQLEE